MDARRSARNSPCAHKAQEGVKGGTLAGGSPFAGGPRRPQPMRATAGLAVDVGKGRRGRRPLRVPAGRAVCRGIYCEIITRSGRGWRNGVTPAVTVTAGRRGRRPLRAGMSCTVLVYGVAKGRGPIPAPTSVYHAPHIEIKKRPSGAFSPFLRRGAPKLQSSAERTPQRPSGTSHASGRGGRVPKPHGGATTPSAFLWGSTPFLWARPKKWGG